MNKQMKKLIVILTALVMVIGMSGCSQKASADEVFAGELVDAQGNRIVVRGSDETMLFATQDGTVYELQNESSLCVGDSIEVDYHRGKDMWIADTVRLTSHQEESMVFGGQVTELDDNYVTVRSESLTAGFEYDGETKINGNLSKGDAVTITYEGDLSERPYAESIVVIQEKREEALKSVHGTVSETQKHSVLISMDSADACRFTINEDTIIKGDSTKVKIGDDVDLIYTGTIGEDPVARAINIRRDKARNYFVMDGVIKDAQSDKLVVLTKKKSYTFKILDETRIQNSEYMIWGHKVTITYVGDLNDKPVAASIYCSKETVTAEDESKYKKEKKSTKAPKIPTEPTDATEATEEVDPTDVTEPTEATDPTEASDPTEDTEATEATDADTPEPAPEPEPEDLIVNINGVINSWGNPCIIKIDGGGTVELDISDASIAGGYVPQVGDQIIASYEKGDMKLLHLQLEYRPAPQQETQKDTGGKTKEDKGDDTNYDNEDYDNESGGEDVDED